MVFGGEGLRVGIRHDKDVSAAGKGNSNPDRELKRLRRMELLEMLVDQIEENDLQSERIDELEDLSNRLKAKLDQKDEQIERLKAKLDEKDALIRDLYMGKGDNDVDRLYMSQNIAGMSDIAMIPGKRIPSMSALDFEGLDASPVPAFVDGPGFSIASGTFAQQASHEATSAVAGFEDYTDTQHATNSAAYVIAPPPMAQGESKRNTVNREDSVPQTDAAAWLDVEDSTDPRSVWILRRQR